MKCFKALTIVVIIICCSVSLRANNINISNITSIPGTGFVQLQFDLSWDNSWYNSVNHDAAWVFFKFKDNDGTWHHLHLTNSNNAITAGYTINVPPDMTGAMIYRNVAGSGTVTLTTIQVGVENLPGSFDIKGFAIEMVQIQIGDTYYLGDGINGVFYSTNNGAPFLVNTNSISLGSGAGLLSDGIANVAVTTPLGASFPIAYNTLGSFSSLYMMKHEISQGAYRDFLNTLTYNQQVTRTVASPNSVAGTQAYGAGTLGSRNTIQVATPGINSSTPATYGCNLNNNGVFNEVNDGEWIACNELTWSDVAAFLDWSALRPMTEMEFEKSCRGPLFPVPGENAAGVVAAAAYSYPIINSGTANEAIVYSGSVLVANITYNTTSPGGSNPTRVGIHATQYATRISAGAGYYGCLDLSGNIEEYTVTTANVSGRSFTGLNGDGQLTPSGNADVDFWPGINGNTTITIANTTYGGATGVTGAAGIISRGGSAAYTGANLNKVSYRTGASQETISTRSPNGSVYGGRGVKNW